MVARVAITVSNAIMGVHVMHLAAWCPDVLFRTVYIHDVHSVGVVLRAALDTPRILNRDNFYQNHFCKFAF